MADIDSTSAQAPRFDGLDVIRTALAIMVAMGHFYTGTGMMPRTYFWRWISFLRSAGLF